MSGHQLDRPGGGIGYLIEGQGDPLLLLHATLSSVRQLRALAGRLAQRHLVISVDRRGHGSSAAAAPRPPAPIDVATHIDDLAALIDEQQLERVDLVGHSYGGCVALELAARQPARVRSVVAYEPPYLPLLPAARLGDKAEAGERTLEAAARSGPAAAALAFMAAVSGEAAVEALSPGARARVGHSGVGAIADATLAGMEPDGLDRISAPVLLAVGGAGEPVYAEIAEAMATHVVGLRVERLAGADHMAPITRPDAFAQVVEDFLAR